MARVKVELRGIGLAYGGTPVLKDIDLVVQPGEFFALLGPSGSGKSTLLRVLAGFAAPQAGSVLLDGEDISRVPPWQRDIGMVFQNYALWPHMTVAQNVAFGLEERRLPRAEVARRAAAALALVGLAELGARRPSQLSGGQQQRVALARTIAIEPKVLLLDEPLSNLDAKLRVHMRAELLALQRKLGITTIFVTHDQEEALSIADRVAVLEGGVIQQVGTPMDLYDDPANRFIANFVGSINIIPGTLVPSGDGLAFRSEVLGEIALDAGAARAGPAEIAVRPHALRLAAPGAPAEPGAIRVRGTVLEREFLGEFVRYRIAVRGMTLIADQAHYSGDAGHAPGSEVAVGINPAQVRLLRV
jgi:iron(III) transport system ATP-binding protein